MQQTSNIGSIKSRQALFPITKSFPQFFNHNLIDDNRVIKILKGEKACLRAFYYQLFKLAFQIQIQPSSDESQQSKPIDYIYQIKKILMKCAQKHKILQFNVQKIKNFINYITQNQRLSFQIQFELDSTLDQAMITILQSFFQQSNIYDNSVQQIFFRLSEIFIVTLNQYQNCLKFSQSDVFIYIQNQQQLYLAFLDVTDPQQNKKNKFQIQKLQCSSQQQKQVVQVVQKCQLEEYVPPRQRQKVKNQKNDTIMNIFGDMLCSSRNQGNSKIFGIDSINNTNNVIPVSPPRQQQKKSIPQQVKLQDKNQNQNDSQGNNYHITQNQKIYQDTKKNNKEQEIKSNQLQQKQQQQDIFYRPKTHMQTIPQVMSPKQSNLHSKYRKDPLDLDNSEEKGTFYRQFTNTRILNILPQSQRTKVKILKSRFIGLHSQITKQ